MRYKLILASLLWCIITPANAQVSIGIRSANVSIGINLPLYPQLVRVPGYPVYYAPDVRSNYFFYDGYYWVYQDDYWYTSDWYNGPWDLVDPFYVPEFILRIPIRYYRAPPQYFLSWRRDAAPRWDEHWGNDWSRRRSGWDRWDRNSAPRPAPLPVYQRQYSGDRYPARVEQQRELRTRNYNYQPRTPLVRELQEQRERLPTAGRAAQEPSRNNSDDRFDARRNQRIEPTQAPQQREAPVRERESPARDNVPQQPSPQAQPRAERQPDSSPREAAPQRNDNAQPDRRQNTDEGQGRNRGDERDERSDRGNRDKDRDR